MQPRRQASPQAIRMSTAHVARQSPRRNQSNHGQGRLISQPTNQTRGRHLAEVGAQEQAACGVLHPLAHLGQVFEDLFGGALMRPDEARPNCTQQVPAKTPSTSQPHEDPIELGCQIDLMSEKGCQSNPAACVLLILPPAEIQPRGVAFTEGCAC